MRPVAEFGAALTLLTRLPGAWAVRGAWPEGAACVWAYPWVGVVVGATGAAVLLGLERCGVPAWPACALGVAACVAVTGGLHEDGLADAADGFGGRTVAARLAIMRDSRIGAHGAVALGLALLVRVGALAALPGGRAAASMVAAHAVGRAAMLVVMASTRPARGGGLGASVAGAGWGRLLAGVASAGVVAWVAGVGLGWGVGLLAGGGVGWGARRWLGGFTGDVLGAACVLGECGLLVAV